MVPFIHIDIEHEHYLPNEIQLGPKSLKQTIFLRAT